MMNFRSFLELFDAGKSSTFYKKEDSGNGKEYGGEFLINNKKYIMYAGSSPEDNYEHWYVSFEIDKKTITQANQKPYKSNNNLLGTGDSFAVMSNVINWLEKFIKTESPTSIIFSATGQSRISLYERLVKKYLEPLGYKTTVIYTDEDDGGKIYNIEKSKFK